MTDSIEPTPKMRREFPSMASDPASVRQRIEGMEKILERMFVIPGINKPVGLDVILDGLDRLREANWQSAPHS